MDLHVSNETARRLERLHVRAWPAGETARVDGWLWRWSGGASQRANSVSTVDFTGANPSAALDRVEAMYRANSSPCQLHTYPFSQPPSLVEELTARGYGHGQTTMTMLATAATATTMPGMPGHSITVSDDPGTEWLDVYLDAITESRRAVNQQILRRIPDPRAFFTVRRGGRAISTALGVVDRGHCVIECVATRIEARGQRGADLAVRALIAWAGSLGAHTIGLQVVHDNHPAIALYRRLGFVPICDNLFWVGR